jgi:hypothetical protein
VASTALESNIWVRFRASFQIYLVINASPKCHISYIPIYHFGLQTSNEFSLAELELVGINHLDEGKQ